MFQALLAAGLILAAADPTPNPAASPTDKSPAAASAAKVPKQVCREHPVLGSRFTRTVCTSRAEIDETASREKLNQLQTNRAR
jgi:hypothetical protein